MRKKKPDKPPVQRSGNPTPKTYERTAAEQKPLTFEELLREFTGQKEEPTPMVEEEERTGEDEPSQDNYEYVNAENSSANQYDIQDQTPYANYEDTYKSYEEVYGQQESFVTLDEQVDLSQKRKKRFEKYKIDELENIQIARRYKEMLMNQDSIRDAIILKEILDRKYF